MALDLEIAGVVRELTETEVLVEAPSRAPTLTRLRDSHHQVARLVAAGLRPAQIATQTGYALSRLSILQNDPAFLELVEFYRVSKDEAAIAAEARFLMIGLDAAQAWHEDLMDGLIVDPTEKREGAKTFLDRAGYAPVQRSLNKNVNLNIAQRMDAKIAKKDEAA